MPPETFAAFKTAFAKARYFNSAITSGTIGSRPATIRHNGKL